MDVHGTAAFADHEQHSCLAIIEINETCNLACPVCFADSSPRRDTHRSLPEIEVMLDALVASEGEPDLVQFSGGEPTLHPDFFPIMDAAKRRPIRHLMINTNGLRIAREAGFADRLVSWRQRPTFLRDLDALRRLIAERMASLDQVAALNRMWRFMNVARPAAARVRDKHGELDVLFARAAGDLASLIRDRGDARTSDALMDAIGHNPRGWRTWLPVVLQDAPEGLAAATLRSMSGLHMPDQLVLVRQLADAAGDVDAYAATYRDDMIRDPGNAAEVANRLIADSDLIAPPVPI